MAHIDDLMDATSSKFHLVMLAAKRAREINSYYQQLGEGTGRFVAPLISTESNKPLTTALEEIAAGKIVEAEPSEEVIEDPLAFIGEQELAGGDVDAPALAAVPDEADVADADADQADEADEADDDADETADE